LERDRRLEVPAHQAHREISQLWGRRDPNRRGVRLRTENAGLAMERDVLSGA